MKSIIMMNIRHLTTLLFALSPAICLPQNAWEKISGNLTGTSEFFILRDSFEVRSNKNGDEIAVVTGKLTDHKSSSIDIYQWYVKTEDCYRQKGKLITLNLDGEFKYESDFIFDAGNIASVNAEAICSLYAEKYLKNRGKGL